MVIEGIKEQHNCRVCRGKLKTVLDFGNIFPSGFSTKDKLPSEKAKAPLELAKCIDCGLAQLKHTIDMDLMYRQYWYSSSLNKSMISSLKEIVVEIEQRVSLTAEDTVIDIGCNDGTMLNLYSKPGFKIGYDPALNLKRPDGIYFINDYFSKEAYFDTYGHTKAKVITAIAMFYDLPDPISFVKDVAELLSDDGIFVIQFTDLVSMFKATAFDNICHEHLEYYRLKDIYNILDRCGLGIIDVSYNDVNGGSIRVTAGHMQSPKVSESVRQALAYEEEFLSSLSWDDFKKNIDSIVTKVIGFLRWSKAKGGTTHILGASTKGNTFLQVCDINSSLVEYAAEVNKDKFGLFTIGSEIEIISENDSLIKHPNYYLVPVWHFKDSILRNPKMLDYMKSGGTLVFPLPEFTIYSWAFDNKITETRI